MHPVVYQYVALSHSRQHKKIPNKYNNIVILTFVYYFVFATCFDPAGSPSGSFRDISLDIELCSNIDP
jgi:hypothetical protein